MIRPPPFTIVWLSKASKNEIPKTHYTIYNLRSVSNQTMSGWLLHDLTGISNICKFSAVGSSEKFKSAEIEQIEVENETLTE